MEAVQIIKKLKHFSFEYDENEKRDLVDIKKFIKDEYSYGFIINKINDNAVPTPNIIKSTGLKNPNISALLLLLAGTKNV